MQVRKDTIRDNMHLVTIVDDEGLTISAGVFDDENTAATVVYLLGNVLEYLGMTERKNVIPPPFLPYNVLRDSMSIFAGKQKESTDDQLYLMKANPA